MAKRRGKIPIESVTGKRRRAHLFVASVLTAATLVTTVTPASAASPGAEASRASTSRVVSAVPPDPGSPLPRRIAQLAIKEIGAAEKHGTNDYPKRYTKVNKHIVWGEAWCGVFAYWVWAKAGVSKRPPMNTRRGMAQGHWATYWQEWGKEHHRWKRIGGKRDPWIGDVIVYGHYPDSGHVGIVVDVKYSRKGKVTHIRTVEGNFGDKVTDRGWRKITQLTGNGQPATGFVSPN
jgi:hypothetical protein